MSPLRTCTKCCPPGCRKTPPWCRRATESAFASTSLAIQICFTPQIDQSRTAVQSLSLDFACPVVVNSNDIGETTVFWDHDESCVYLQRASNHVLNGISVPGCNDEVWCFLSVQDSFGVQATVAPRLFSFLREPESNAKEGLLKLSASRHPCV